MKTASPKWDQPEYRRITCAEVQSNHVLVTFADRTEARLETHQLAAGSDLDWRRMTFTPYELIVPSGSGEVEVPWSSIRLLSDPEYSAHLAAAAEEEAHNIGKRLKELRKNRNLTAKELAQRAGITPQSLSRIEHGHHDVVFTTLQRLLAAMGYTVRDLAT